ncbi:MAG: Sec-independent protein translocase protein TatA [Planctomycetota bacterium]
MAFITNLTLSEIVIIVIGAIILFGKDLPQVAMKGAAQVMRLRRQLGQMWREAGLEEEMRKVRRDLDASVPKLPPDQSFFDTPSSSEEQADDLASSLKPAGDVSYLEPDEDPDEDPDERADWENESHYGPSEEEQRAAEPEPEALDAPEYEVVEEDETPKGESA